MENHYDSLMLKIEKYALENYINTHLDKFGVLQVDKEDDYFKIINVNNLCRILSTTIYPYTRTHYEDYRISTFNRMWGKQIYSVGGAVDPKYTVDVSLPNLNIFVTNFRKIFNY